ncbi:MAG: Re/Si-specific NAD(P)(+) transhydrogenase subunit alpha [Actinomycetota bacterium]|nr:Re/Si-specific NAD(P)(+) transhydrogenase subunit alpha [Actinomycetota bacterium]MDA8279233.1 Re/Si-specific NAD(P)(+) transhydrogenase subunit alpha [Actinomycetota bacterium]
MLILAAVKLAVPTETMPGERRVAVVPDVVARLAPTGVEVAVQSGAGVAAGFPDEAYRDKGATVSDLESVLRSADMVATVQPPTPDEVASWPEGLSVVGFLQPGAHSASVSALSSRRSTAYSLDLLPRISRAQSMDALSSQATVSGYRAVLDAAELLPKFFPLLMTAAGTVPPAKVLIMGAGVAGLQAIATARRLGAQVRAYDVRSAAKEEVQSLGATFVELPLETQEGSGGYAREQSEDFLARQREMLSREVAAADVVITTAAIPGRRAPVLITRAMVEQMEPGAVIVDLAADSGGNCEPTEAGRDVVVGRGVVVRGLSNPPSSMPAHASFLYARNIANFLGLLVSDGVLAPDFDDEVVAGTCVVRSGDVVNAAARDALGLPPLAPAAGHDAPAAAASPGASGAGAEPPTAVLPNPTGPVDPTAAAAPADTDQETPQ